MAGEIVIDFTRSFPNRVIEASAELELASDATLVVFGPSGSGKTTILRAIAGLDRPDEGMISFDGVTWFDSSRNVHVSPQDRLVGYLSQSYDLFPHLTVHENVRFGARDPDRAESLLGRFGISGLAGRRPANLSGGEKQRVALARAVAREPRLLLLDEPLSALDAPTREALRNELRSMIAEASAPAIVVTHDRNEALALGDTMAVVIDGRIVQTGPVENVFNRPISAEVARATGIETVLPVEVVSSEPGLVLARHGATVIESAASTAKGHARAFALIRAADVTIDRERLDGISARNQISGTIRSIANEEPLVRLHLDCGFDLIALITRRSFDDLALSEGTSVVASIKASAIRLVPR